MILSDSPKGRPRSAAPTTRSSVTASAPDSYCGEGPRWYTAPFPTGDSHRALNDRRKLLKIIMRSRLSQFLALTVTMPGLTCVRFSLSAIVMVLFIPYHPGFILSAHFSPMRLGKPWCEWRASALAREFLFRWAQSLQLDLHQCRSSTMNRLRIRILTRARQCQKTINTNFFRRPA